MADVPESPLKVKYATGRPLLFKSPEELQEKADVYFAECELKGEIPLLSGLAVHLDCDRKTLANYSSDKEFFPIVRRIKQRCEHALERRLVDKETYTTGQIFALKNGYGWNEDQQVKHSGTIDSPGSEAIAGAMGAFAAMLQESAKAKLVAGEVIEGE